MNFYIKSTTLLIFIIFIQCQILLLVAGVDLSSTSASKSQSQDQATVGNGLQHSHSVSSSVSSAAESNVVFIQKTPQSLLNEGAKKKFKISHKRQRSSAAKLQSQSFIGRAEANVTENHSDAAKYSHEMTKTSRRSPLKDIKDLIVYSLSNQNIGEPRTGLMLFMGITALEIFTITTLFFGLTGAIIAGLVGMVKLMAAGSIIMIG